MSTRSNLRQGLLGLIATMLLATACKRGDDTLLLVTAEVAPAGQQPLGASGLTVTVSDGVRQSGTHTFVPPSGVGILFPATFSVQLSREVKGPLSMTVVVVNPGGAVLAEGRRENLEIRSGERRTVTVVLQCRAGCGAVGDGGVVDAADAAPDGAPTPRPCGNGVLDPGELCDTAILPGRWGACPPADCDDGLSCTVDRAVGSGCRLVCEHAPVTTNGADRCCPAGASAASDPDCPASCGNGTVETVVEACELSLPPSAPGACPDVEACADQDPCTTDLLVSGGTCAATCAHYPILTLVSGDRCCPPGGTAASDSDCPAVCGNRRKDPGETCDRAASSESGDACPTACQDMDPCTTDLLVGAGCQVQCQHLPVTRPVAGDLCCPTGANRNLDPDCPARCGNGVLEAGEACDSALPAGQPGSCPTSCPASNRACFVSVLDGLASECATRCLQMPVRVCSAQPDGCCPDNCTSSSDADCSPTCGNGAVEVGEACDRGIAPPAPGACPQSCDDGNACTENLLVSLGTCSARCEFPAVSALISGDGCCPAGASALLDSDCAAACGNGLVEAPRETCDRGLPAERAGSCPSACPSLPAGCQQLRLTGSAASCTSVCQLTEVKACAPGDGCCPAGCTQEEDGDCPAVCGNGKREIGEVCDRGISAGNPDACPSLCDDYKACTTDTSLGRIWDCTRSCRHDPITVCRGGDGCCPEGCGPELDRDCKPVCGNQRVEAGEFCDPPASCPSTCPDDGDPCTAAPLRGEAATCTARCEQVPLLVCSGASADRCCPSGCTAAQDIDCGGSPKPAP